MDALHKILTFLTNPLTLGLAGLLVVVGYQLLVEGKKETTTVHPGPSPSPKILLVTSDIEDLSVEIRRMPGTLIQRYAPYAKQES